GGVRGGARGKCWGGWLVRGWLSGAMSRFMNAREVTSVTSPSCPVRTFSFAVSQRRRKRCVAHHRVDFRLLNRIQDFLRLGQLRCERLLDQQGQAAIDGGEDRVDVQVFIRGNDDGRYLRTLQELAI